MLQEESSKALVEDLRFYAKGKKGELEAYVTAAADRIEELDRAVTALEAQDAPKWITDREPTEEECEACDATGFIVCISGIDGSLQYDHAIDMTENYYDHGEWFIHGCKKDGITVHAWMLPPSWED